MQTEFSVDYFIKKFEAIPEDEWCVELLHDGKCRCVLGHCGVDEMRRFSSEAWNLTEVLSVSTPFEVAEINDGHNRKFQQPTPKQRILAALKLIKEKQV